MTTVTAPATSISFEALLPDVVRSCIVVQPSPPPEPGSEPPDPVEDTGIYTPVPDGVTYDDLPVVTVIDTSPDQMIGCIITVADNPQGRLDALFPSAIDGDGVIDRATNDIWVYDGAAWNNVGPTPGEVIVETAVIPPWDETIIALARTRTKLRVEALPYALDLLTEPAALLTRTRLGAAKVLPYAEITVAGNAPSIATGIKVSIPAANIALAAELPSLASGVTLQIPVTTIGVNTLPGMGYLPYVGEYAKVVQIPLVDTELSIYTPTIITGRRVQPSAIDIAFAAHAPLVNEIATPTVVKFTSQFGGTEAYTDNFRPYLANDILLYFCEISGADVMPGVPVEDGVFRDPPDAMGTWQLVPGAPVTDLATTSGSKLYVWWMRANFDSDDYDETDIPDSGDHQVGRCLVVRGCRTTGDPYDVVATASKTTASTVATAPAVTTTVKNTLVVSCISRPNDSSNTGHFNTLTNASLSDFTTRGEMGTTAGNGGGFVVTTGVKAEAGNTGVTTAAVTDASTTNASITIALRG